MMMERRVIMFCCVVGFLGLVSVATGFGAEATRLKDSDVMYFPATKTCRSSGSPVVALGVTSLLTLVVAQIIMSCEAGCICCRRGPSPSTLKLTLAIICFIVSWLAFVVALLIRVSGAVMSSQSGQDAYARTSNSCYLVCTGVFSAGAILSLASGVLIILHYLLLNSVKKIDEAPPVPPHQEQTTSLRVRRSCQSRLLMLLRKFSPHQMLCMNILNVYYMCGYPECIH